MCYLLSAILAQVRILTNFTKGRNLREVYEVNMFELSYKHSDIKRNMPV